jgi:hypothetical protein
MNLADIGFLEGAGGEDMADRLVYRGERQA